VVRFAAGIRNFSVCHRVETGYGVTQPLIHCVPAVLSPKVKRPKREADNSSLSSAEFNNVWRYVSTPQ